MPEKLFPSPTAERAAQYVRDVTATPREKYRMSVITLFGTLFRRLTYVQRLNPTQWFSYDPDALTGPDQ